MKYEDVKTSVDCRYLSYRDLGGIGHLNGRRIARRRRRRFLDWLRGLR